MTAAQNLTDLEIPNMTGQQSNARGLDVAPDEEGVFFVCVGGRGMWGNDCA